jgi:CRP/FNR family cyclic AMP-dependent transcriptional regulator
MTLQGTLAEHAFTRGLGQDQLAELAAMACEVTFEEDQLILEDGCKSEWFFLVIAGSVTVELRTPSYAVSVQAVGPGQAFGWSALLEDHESLFQVRAREHTVALRLEGACLKATFHKDPVLGTELLSRVLKLVAGRVRATEVRFAEMCGVRA